MCPESMKVTVKLKDGVRYPEAERSLLESMQNYDLCDAKPDDGWGVEIAVPELRETTFAVIFDHRFFNYGNGVSLKLLRKAVSEADGIDGIESVVVTDSDGIDWVPVIHGEP